MNWWEKLKGESNCPVATVPSYGSGPSVSTAHQSVSPDDKGRTFEPSYLKYPPLFHSRHFVCNSQDHL